MNGEADPFSPIVQDRGNRFGVQYQEWRGPPEPSPVMTFRRRALSQCAEPWHQGRPRQTFCMRQRAALCLAFRADDSKALRPICREAHVP